LLTYEQNARHLPLPLAALVVLTRHAAMSISLSPRLGATIQHPGWGGTDVGFLPFPVHRLVEAAT
jgi:hypothetical protein